MRARKRVEPTQLDRNMARIKIVHGRLVIDGEVIGDRLDNNEEIHFLHYYLAVNLHHLKPLRVTRHIDDANPE